MLFTVQSLLCCNRAIEQNRTEPNQTGEQYVRCAYVCVLYVSVIVIVCSLYLLNSRIIQDESRTHTQHTHTHMVQCVVYIYINQSAFHITLSFIVVVARVRLLLSRHFFGVVFPIILVLLFLSVFFLNIAYRIVHIPSQ